jgi:tetratricopeptide (TPR) repeat protein
MSNRKSLKDFYQGLEALRAKDIRHTRGARSAYCREQLRVLEERKPSATPEDLAQINADTAIVRMYLAGECLFPEGLEAQAIEEGEIALREALASGLTVIVYECLGCLGSWYLVAGKEEQAIVCFQRAIVYSHDPADPTQLRYREVLQWLGSVWARTEETMPLARMTAQWRRALDPYGLDTWRDEYLWLIQFRHFDEVQAVLDSPPPVFPIEAARLTAALLALGRYDEAMDAARTGRSIALAQGDVEWSRTFDLLLSPESPALQGR